MSRKPTPVVYSQAVAKSSGSETRSESHSFLSPHDLRKLAASAAKALRSLSPAGTPVGERLRFRIRPPYPMIGRVAIR